MRYVIGAAIGITVAWYAHRMWPHILILAFSRGDR